MKKNLINLPVNYSTLSIIIAHVILLPFEIHKKQDVRTYSIIHLKRQKKNKKVKKKNKGKMRVFMKILFPNGFRFNRFPMELLFSIVLSAKRTIKQTENHSQAKRYPHLTHNDSKISVNDCHNLYR